MEDNPPGKLAQVNDGDANGNGIPGFADWYEPDNHFAPMTLKIPDTVDVTRCKLKIEYADASSPALVAHDGTPPVWKPAPGRLRLWKRDANEPRNPTSANAQYPGDYVEPGWYTIIGKLGFSAETREVTLYVEGIAPSATPGDQRIVVTLYEGDPPTRLSSDAVRVTVVGGGIIPDFNHDRKTDETDRWLAVSYPQHFWINDDADVGDEVSGDSDLPGSTTNPNWADEQVNGRSDLIDFFPVWLDIQQVLQLYAAKSKPIIVTLDQEDEAVNIVYTDLDKDRAGDYLTVDAQTYGVNRDQNAHEAASLTARTLWNPPSSVAYFTLDANFVNRIRNGEGKGIVLVEARKPTDKPLTLQIRDAAAPVTPMHEFKLNLSISGVEQMFRHLNLNDVASGGNNEVDSRETAPNWPDNLSNGKNFVFLHGYNVNQQQARGWSAEIFKRMWWSGSNARFHAVSWRGYDTQTIELPGVGTLTVNLQTNIVHAFETAPALANYLNGLSGETVIAGHSLGNMLASAVITLNTGTAAKYFVINGAVAMEAFDPDLPKSTGMMNQDWIDYFYFDSDPERLFASEWHKLFPNTEDPRSRLTWRGIFINWGNTAVYNFYSTGEEVLGNIPQNQGNSIYQIHHALGFAWGCQEKLKGRMPLEILGSTIGGWEFNQDNYGDWIPSNDPENPDPIWVRETPASAAVISAEQLVTQPFFKKLPAELFSSNVAIAQGCAEQHRYDLLSRAIPARTFAVGANPIGSGFEQSVNMQSMQPSGWPAGRGVNTRWEHSDCKKVAYLFIHQLFENIVNLGELE